MTQPTNLQAEINQYWNQQAAKLGADGTPHHNMRDDAQRRVWMDALRPLLPPQDNGSGGRRWIRGGAGQRSPGLAGAHGREAAEMTGTDVIEGRYSARFPRTAVLVLVAAECTRRSWHA